MGFDISDYIDLPTVDVDTQVDISEKSKQFIYKVLAFLLLIVLIIIFRKKL